MATLAIGDIHGHRPALEDLLGQIAGEVAEGDTVVFLGDYIDRGPDSKGCVDAILRFRSEVRADVVCLLGNHEDWLLRTMANHERHSFTRRRIVYAHMAAWISASPGLRSRSATR